MTFVLRFLDVGRSRTAGHIKMKVVTALQCQQKLVEELEKWLPNIMSCDVKKG